MPTIGELRHTSFGNVFRLDAIDGEWRRVRRVSNSSGSIPWDSDVLYRWHSSQWEEQLPIVDGPTAEYQHFGVFIP